MTARRKLDIIGNGFDLHHGIPSGYSHFGEYLKDVDRGVAGLIQRYYPVDKNFWSEFETRLGDFDADTVMDDNSVFLAAYGADDWSDAGHHDYEYEVRRTVRGLSETMRSHFSNWIRALPIPTRAKVVRLVPIDPRAIFLSFNYTPTLQQVYSVPDAQILHIHGSSADPTADLVLGHGWERTEPERFAPQIDEDTDVRIAGGYELLDQYFDRTFKPTGRIIAENQKFFDDLTIIEQVRVMGHALWPVDRPYFDAVLARLSLDKVDWLISWHEDLEGMRSRAAAYGIPLSRAEFKPLSAF